MAKIVHYPDLQSLSDEWMCRGSLTKEHLVCALVVHLERTGRCRQAS